MRTRIAAVTTAVVVVAFLLGVAGPAGAAPKGGKGGIGSLAVSPNPVDEGTTATVSGNLDSGCQSNHLHIDWGDGTSDDFESVPPGPFPSAGSTIPHVYADDDPTGTSSDEYTVAASFAGSTPGCADQGTANTKVTVQNVAPSIDSMDVFARGPRQTTSLDGTFSDGGTQDSYTVTINWGDGTSNTVLLLPAIMKIRSGHAYAASGQYRVNMTVQDDDNGTDRDHVDVTVPVMDPRVLTGADAGGGPLVKVRAPSPQGLQPIASFFAYRSSFTGGVRVAAGDVNGDGVDDFITAPGPGGPPLVRVWNGTDGSPMNSFFAYRSSFTGGVFVAAGDLNGDGVAEIVTGADAGAGPHVKVFAKRSKRLTVIDSFFAYQSSFTGGVRVAVGDVNGDGFQDIITGAGAGAGPHVKVFSADPAGGGEQAIMSFFAYPSAFSGGVRVAGGDVDGDGSADIITAPGKGGSPLVKVFNGVQGNLLQNFFAYQSSFTGGVFVAYGQVPETPGP